MNFTLRLAYAFVASLIFIANMWAAVLISHWLPDGWVKEWYGLPLVVTLSFCSLVGVSPAILLVECLISGKPLNKK